MVNQKIYVRMENDEVCMKFYEWAEHEGYTFGGEKPTSKHPSDLIAVLPGKALCYVNTYGRIAAHSGTENVILIDICRLVTSNIIRFVKQIR